MFVILMTPRGKTLILITALLAVCAALAAAGCVTPDTPEISGDTMTITDAFGRQVTIPANPEKVAVVGSGSMRYFMYLDLDTDLFVAVDFQDGRLYPYSYEHRPYALAHPELKDKQEVGAAKGVVDNEKLLMSGAEILFMGGASSSNTEVANEIQEKTGVPVVMFYTGNYVTDAEKIQDSILMIAQIFGVEDRASELFAYFDAVEADLIQRAEAHTGEKPSVYVAGVSYNGAHGIDATDPTYYPFEILNADNVASGISSVSTTGYAQISKEKLLEWDPEVIIVDLATLTAAEGGAIEEMKNDPSYKELTAVKTGQVYTINPHTAMNVNHETTLANAYYIGKVLYPEQFADINPEKKADEIYTEVVGAPIYEELKGYLDGLSYQKITF